MQVLSTNNCSTILSWPFLLRNYTVIFFLPKTIQIIYKRPFLKTLQQFKRSAKKADKRKTVFKKRSVFMMFSFSTVRKKKEEKIIRATLNGIEGCMKEGIIAFVEKRKQASTWLWTWSKVADITLTKTVENAHIKYKDGRRRKKYQTSVLNDYFYISLHADTRGIIVPPLENSRKDKSGKSIPQVRRQLVTYPCRHFRRWHRSARRRASWTRNRTDTKKKPNPPKKHTH